MYQLPLDPTAVQGRRIGAWLIDFVFASVLAIIALNVALDVYQAGPGNRCADDDDRPSAEVTPICTGDFRDADGLFIYDENTDETVFVAGDVWLPVALFVGYGLITFVLVEGIVGASIGKLIVGLRVVRADGQRAGIGRSALRFLLWLVDGFPYCFPLVGFVTGLTTKGHRRLGDMAAGTFVVNSAAAGHPVTIPGLTAPAALAYAPPSEPGPYIPPAAPPWGAPQSSAPWDAPWDAPAGPLAPASTTPEKAPPPDSGETSKPQWDADRNTYIQWDVHRNAWLQWDTDLSEWKPIE